jgi:hypothetical protein
VDFFRLLTAEAWMSTSFFSLGTSQTSACQCTQNIPLFLM